MTTGLIKENEKLRAENEELKAQLVDYVAARMGARSSDRHVKIKVSTACTLSVTINGNTTDRQMLPLDTLTLVYLPDQ